MSDYAKSLIFATILCIVCSSLLTAAASGLKKIQQKNILVDQRKNILKSVGLIEEKREYTASEIDRMFSQNIRRVDIDKTGNLIQKKRAVNEANNKTLPVYLYQKKEGLIEAYIIPINTRGLWGEILGYLALKNDGKTISGFTVYKHSETPGLGGEIEQHWFQSNFIGKKITGPSGEFASISIAKGKVEDSISREKRENYVDGISGATLTGKFLSKGMKEVLSGYEPVSIIFRKKLQFCKTNPNTPWCKK
ncbi:MAG: FMN-binding protein [Deltaproteobacteria bacterium]|nr:FMN-binding protein [Deltaproteobacteria bacterium]